MTSNYRARCFEFKLRLALASKEESEVTGSVRNRLSINQNDCDQISVTSTMYLSVTFLLSIDILSLWSQEVLFNLTFLCFDPGTFLATVPV